MSLPQRKQMTFDDGSVSFLEWEADAPVLHFAHANGFNAETYRALLQPLAGRFHIYASDLRGHGFTTLPAVPGMQTRWGIYGEDLARFIAGLPRGPIVLAGHSMGSIASLMVAAKQPNQVRALVLSEPVLIPEQFEEGMLRPPGPNLADLTERRRETFASFDAALNGYRGRGAFRTWPEEMVADYLHGGLIATGNGHEMRLACAPQWEAANFRNAPAGISSLAADVRCPFTLLHAAATDGTSSPGEIQKIARMQPDARIIRVPDTTHFLPMEEPQVVRDAILEYA